MGGTSAYRYAYYEAGGPHGNDLTLATSGGSAAHPYLFSGGFADGYGLAQAMLVVSEVARSRFYVPAATVAKIIRLADPVVTSEAETLRFESFSACNGVYARLDVDVAQMDAARRRGTTNVDFGSPMRSALGRIRPNQPLLLNVGHDEVSVTTLSGAVSERRVPLPERWLRGFAEACHCSASMLPIHEVDRAATTAFMRSIPSRSRGLGWTSATARGIRIASLPRGASACVAGGFRLRVVARLMPAVESLRVYGPLVEPADTPVPSAWEFDLGFGRLTLVLSPDLARGFSGEGSYLMDAARDASFIAGAAGYDLAASQPFSRELPFGPELAAAESPRLAAARQLVDVGHVRLVDGGAIVSSDATDYRVSTDGTPRCSCRWFSRYGGSRGPCKHLLATVIASARVAA